jgi:hypothetical protein
MLVNVFGAVRTPRPPDEAYRELRLTSWIRR